MAFEELAPGWTVWSHQETKTVLTYRPDVFDSVSYPAACLPTIYVTNGQRGRRPGRPTPSPDDAWYVTLYLEPDVSDRQREFETKAAAVDGATALAREFADGEIDYRALYQVPRPAYFDKLDELTGRS